MRFHQPYSWLCAQRIVLALVLCLMAASASAEDVRIGVVDLEQAITGTAEGKSAREELERRVREAEAQLQPLVDQLKAMFEEVEAKQREVDTANETLRQAQDNLRQQQTASDEHQLDVDHAQGDVNRSSTSATSLTTQASDTERARSLQPAADTSRTTADELRASVEGRQGSIATVKIDGTTRERRIDRVESLGRTMDRPPPRGVHVDSISAPVDRLRERRRRALWRGGTWR